MKKLQITNLVRSLAGRQALVLAATLCLVVTAPALADFESAVAAYEDGAYREAQTEFEALAVSGDSRATPYLESIREKLRQDRQTGAAANSTFMDTLMSFFGEADTVSDGPVSNTASHDAGSSAASRSPAAAPGRTPFERKTWSAFDNRSEPAPLPTTDVAVPERQSIWSSMFHLPGDATVVGLQYVAQFLEADTLSRELQLLGRQSNRIALSILAGFWWLVIVRAIVGFCASISRLMKSAATTTEQKHYG